MEKSENMSTNEYEGVAGVGAGGVTFTLEASNPANPSWRLRGVGRAHHVWLFGFPAGGGREWEVVDLTLASVETLASGGW